MTHTTDVLIVGGGVIGCAIARDLSIRGYKTVILERGEPCREASWAAAGALIARALSADEGPLLPFKIESLSLFREYCQALAEDTGIDSGYRETGGIDFFLTEEEIEEIGQFLEWQKIVGVPAQRLTPGELRDLEPDLSPSIQESVLFPTFTQVRTPWFTQALLRSALKHGAQLQAHTEVREFIRKGNRILGVRTDSETWTADQVILAAGAWSTYLATLFDRRVPGVPVKGQIILLQDQGYPVRHIVHHGKTYITPRDDGRLVVGSTEEWVGFQRQNTVEGVNGLLEHACEFYPCLGRSTLERIWHGFRPLTYDGLPFIGRFDGLEGLVCATGHYRSGIILAPLTGKVVGELMSGELMSFDITPFSPDRVGPSDGLDLCPHTDLH